MKEVRASVASFSDVKKVLGYFSPEEANEKLVTVLTNMAIVSALILTMVFSYDASPSPDSIAFFSTVNIWGDWTEAAVQAKAIIQYVSVILNLACTVESLCLILRLSEIPKHMTASFLADLKWTGVGSIYNWNSLGINGFFGLIVMQASISYRKSVFCTIVICVGLYALAYYPYSFFAMQVPARTKALKDFQTEFDEKAVEAAAFMPLLLTLFSGDKEAKEVAMAFVSMGFNKPDELQGLREMEWNLIQQKLLSEGISVACAIKARKAATSLSGAKV